MQTSDSVVNEVIQRNGAHTNWLEMEVEVEYFHFRPIMKDILTCNLRETLL